MGGTTFECTAKGDSVREAYDEAVRQAQYDYGHSGYTGTIAECDGYVVIDSAGPMDLDQASAFGRKLIDEDDRRISDKWGPAGAIALADGSWYFFGWASC
jgi:hypothetical protein